MLFHFKIMLIHTYDSSGRRPPLDFWKSRISMRVRNRGRGRKNENRAHLLVSPTVICSPSLSSRPLTRKTPERNVGAPGENSTRIMQWRAIHFIAQHKSAGLGPFVAQGLAWLRSFTNHPYLFSRVQALVPLASPSGLFLLSVLLLTLASSRRLPLLNCTVRRTLHDSSAP